MKSWHWLALGGVAFVLFLTPWGQRLTFGFRHGGPLFAPTGGADLGGTKS